MKEVYTSRTENSLQEKNNLIHRIYIFLPYINEIRKQKPIEEFSTLEKIIYIFANSIDGDIMEIEEEMIQVMKKKAERFNQDEVLTHYAMQRQLGKWVIEGEKKLKYEEGKVGEKLKDVRTVIQRLYKTNNSDWLDNRSYEQLDIIFDQALMNTPLSQIQQNINQNNV